MMRSLYSGVSGLRNHQTRMDVIGNNIANVNTVGFKSSRVIFQDLYSQNMRAASSPGETTGGTNPQQIGLGMTLSTIDTLFTRSAAQVTGSTYDLMIENDGFFVVRNGYGSSYEEFYTRAGNFYEDKEHYLVTAGGFYLQGYKSMLTQGTDPVSSVTVGMNPPQHTTAQAAVAPTVRSPSSGIIATTVPAGRALNGTRIGFTETAAGSGIYNATVSAGGATYTGTFDYASGLAGGAPATAPGVATAGVTAVNVPAGTSLNGANITFTGPGPILAAEVTVGGETYTGTIDASTGLIETLTLTNPSGDAIELSVDTAVADETALLGSGIDFDATGADAIPGVPGPATLTLTDSVGGGTIVLDIDTAQVTQAVLANNGIVFNSNGADAVPASSDAISDVYSMDLGAKNNERRYEITVIDSAKRTVEVNSTSLDGSISYGKQTITLPAPDGVTEKIANLGEISMVLTADYDINSLDGFVVTTTNTGVNSEKMGDPYYNITNEMDRIYIDENLYNISIDKNGNITGIVRSDGVIRCPSTGDIIQVLADQKVVIGRVTVATFDNQQGLEKVGSNLYRSTSNTGDAQYKGPGMDGAGQINPGALEMSNVDLAQEFTDMIVTQRGFQANSRIITVSDTLLEELVNLKR